MRTLLIGIDAATRPILERLSDDGGVETLHSLSKSGVCGTLESQIPPWTASAWPSMYTGKNPGKHGVFGFLNFEGYDWDIVNATNVQSRTLWEYLDIHGLTSVIVNVPVTHPPRPFDGALIPGYTAPESPLCHPEGILEELSDKIGEYNVYEPRDDLDREETLTWFRRLTQMRGSAFCELTRRFEPDFGFVQFQQTDTVFHKLPGDFDAVRLVYEEVDDQVTKILEECDPETVIVASDHGIGQYTKQTFRVNQFLADTGYLTVKRGGEGMPTWVTIREEHLKEGSTGDETGPRYLGLVLAASAKIGLTTDRIAAALDTVGLSDWVAKHVSPSTTRAGMKQVAFPASRAYMRDSMELGIRLNIEGREPDGMVPESEYETVREELIEQLRTVKTPDGEQVFDEVVPREEYFHGPASGDAVDIVTIPADFEFQLSIRLDGDQFGPLKEPWHHKLEGIIIASGVAIDDEQSLEGAHLFDVAPTVLAMFGLPWDTEMDGKPLPIIADPGRRSYPEQSSQPRVRTNRPEVEQRLADLGYIE